MFLKMIALAVISTCCVCYGGCSDGNGSETDAGTDTGTDTDSDNDANADPGLDTDTETDADSDNYIDADPDSDTDTETDADSDTDTDSDYNIIFRDDFEDQPISWNCGIGPLPGWNISPCEINTYVDCNGESYWPASIASGAECYGGTGKCFRTNNCNGSSAGYNGGSAYHPTSNHTKWHVSFRVKFASNFTPDLTNYSPNQIKSGGRIYIDENRNGMKDNPSDQIRIGFGSSSAQVYPIMNDFAVPYCTNLNYWSGGGVYDLNDGQWHHVEILYDLDSSDGDGFAGIKIWLDKNNENSPDHINDCGSTVPSSSNVGFESSYGIGFGNVTGYNSKNNGEWIFQTGGDEVRHTWWDNYLISKTYQGNGG